MESRHGFPIAFVAALFLSLPLAQAVSVGGGVTYHGRLLKANGRPVEAPNVQFRVQIRTPPPANCLMYEEIHVRDMLKSEGLFSITLNDEPAVMNTEPFTLEKVFQNRGQTLTFPVEKCSGTDTVTFDPSLPRQIVVGFNDGSFPVGEWEPLPPQAINFVPAAFEAVTVGGFRGNQLFRVVDPSGMPQNLGAWSVANYEKLTELVGSVQVSGGVTNIGGTSSGFTGSLAGDVTGTQGATSVVRIQGQNVSHAWPANGDVLSWNNAFSRWEAKALPAGNTPIGSAGGDLSGSYPNPVIADNAVTGNKIPSGAIGTTHLQGGTADGQVHRYSVTGWQTTKLGYRDLVNSVSASPWPSTTCAAGQAVIWTSVSDSFVCQSLALNSSNIVDGSIATADLADGSVTNQKIQSVSVDKITSGAGLYLTYQPNGAACAAGQVLKWQNSRWECATDSDTVVASGTSAGQVLRWTGSAWAPSTDASSLTSLNASQITSGSLPVGRLPALGGDVTMAAGTNTVTVTKLQGDPISATDPTANQVLKWVGGAWTPSTDLNSGGTVTSVSGSAPITVANGTTTPSISLANEGVTSAHIQNGTIVAADLAANAVTSDKISGLAVNKITSGAGLYLTYQPNGAACTSGQVLKWQNSRWECASDNNTGTITNVAGTAPITVANGTTAPVISIANGSTAGQMLRWSGSAWSASTDGSALTGLNASNLSSGTLASGRLPALTGDVTMAAGTNTVTVTKLQGDPVSATAPAANQVLKWNGSAWTPSADANSGGTVTSVSGTAPIMVTNGGTTPSISLAAGGVTTGHIQDGTIATADLANGSVTNEKINSVTVNKVANGAGLYFGYAPNNAACAAGQILKWQNSRWECGTDNVGTTGVTSVATGTGLTGGTITSTGTISIANGGVGTNQIANGAVTSAKLAAGAAAANLGFTPVNKAGDTMTGRLGLSAAGLHVAAKDDINARTDSGFFETSTASTAEGWPANGSWYHLMSATHSNVGNYYSMQIAGDFYNSNNVFYRATNGSGATGWNRLWHSGNLTNLNQLANGPGYINGITSAMVTGALGYTPLANTSLSGQGIAYNGAGGPQVYGAGGGASMISFHRPGSYAVNFGLDTDNVLKVGGWSMGGPHTIWHSGNFNPGTKLTLDAWNGSSYVATDGRHYGTIFYDSDNTGFYVDPSGVSNMNDVRASIFYDRDNTTRYLNPDGHSEIGRIRTNTNWDGYQGGIMIHGNAPTVTMQDTDSNIRWMMHNNSDVLYFQRANTAGGTDWDNKVMISNDGNIWSKALGDWFTNRLGQDVRAGSSPNFWNITLGYLGTPLSNRLDQDVRSSAAPHFSKLRLNTSNSVHTFEVGGNIGLAGGVITSWSAGQVYNIPYGTNPGAGFHWRHADPANIASYSDMMVLYPDSNLWVAGTYVAASDERLKKDISPIPDSLRKLTELEGVTYHWRDTGKDPNLQIGLIAQDVEKVFPEAVSTDKKGIKGVAYAVLVAPIINALGEIRDWMNGTDERVAALESENRMMKNYLCAKDPGAPFCASSRAPASE